MRATWAAACLAMAGVLAATGCTGGDPQATSSPTPSNTAAHWRHGEFTTHRNHCHAIPPSVLKPLNLRIDGGGTASTSYCDVRRTDFDTPVTHAMKVRIDRFAPSPARPDRSATDDARHDFAKPDGWRPGEGAALRGYGDDGRISRTISRFQFKHAVKVAVRARNVIIQVELSSSTEKHGGRVTPTGGLETSALRAVRGMLGDLGAPVRPAKPAAPRSGEVAKVHDVCRDVKDAAALVPGGKRVRVAAPGGRSAGCAWTKTSDSSLEVAVEAVPPGADGRDATATAAEAAGGWGAKGDKKVPGVGDAAVVHTFTPSTLRAVELLVRRGNLLVTVRHSRWHGDRSVKAMRGDAVKAAKAALGGYT